MLSLHIDTKCLCLFKTFTCMNTKDFSLYNTLYFMVCYERQWRKSVTCNVNAMLICFNGKLLPNTYPCPIFFISVISACCILFSNVILLHSIENNNPQKISLRKILIMS